MIHRPQTQIFHPQIPKRLQKLNQRKTSIHLRLPKPLFDSQHALHLLLNLRVIIVLISTVRIKLLLKLSSRQRRIHPLNHLPVVRIHQVRIELHHSVENVRFSMSLQMIEILDKVIREKINLVRISMHLLGKSNTPNHSVNTPIKIILGQFRSVEVHLKHTMVHLQHSLERSSQHVTLLQIHRLRTPNNLHPQNKINSISQSDGLNSTYLLQPVHNQPQMNLHHLSTNHIIMRNIQSSSELGRSEVTHHPQKDLVLNPIVILTALWTVITTSKPSELQIVKPSPVQNQFLTTQKVLHSRRVLQRLEKCTKVKVRKIRISRLPVLLLLQNSLLTLTPSHLLHQMLIRTLIQPFQSLRSHRFILLSTQVNLLQLPLQRTPLFPKIKSPIQLLRLLLHPPLGLTVSRSLTTNQHLPNIFVQHLLEMILTKVRNNKSRVYFRRIVLSDRHHHLVTHRSKFHSSYFLIENNLWQPKW